MLRYHPINHGIKGTNAMQTISRPLTINVVYSLYSLSDLLSQPSRMYRVRFVRFVRFTPLPIMQVPSKFDKFVKIVRFVKFENDEVPNGCAETLHDGNPLADRPSRVV
jgi:hypothetical protein